MNQQSSLKVQTPDYYLTSEFLLMPKWRNYTWIGLNHQTWRNQMPMTHYCSGSVPTNFGFRRFSSPSLRRKSLTVACLFVNSGMRQDRPLLVLQKFLGLSSIAASADFPILNSELKREHQFKKYQNLKGIVIVAPFSIKNMVNLQVLSKAEGMDDPILVQLTMTNNKYNGSPSISLFLGQPFYF